MLCEECGENEATKSAIVDGVIVNLCDKCSLISRGVIIERPSQEQVDESKRMWRVKEILSRSAGIPYKYTPSPVNLPSSLRTVSLEDLRRIDKDKKSAYQLRAEARLRKDIEEAEEKRAKEAQRIIEESKTFKDEVELVD